jgi:hypothetical protein
MALSSRTQKSIRLLAAANRIETVILPALDTAIERANLPAFQKACTWLRNERVSIATLARDVLRELQALDGE